MPDPISELQAYLSGSGGSAVDDLRAYLAAPTTRPTSAAPTEEEMAIIRGAPPNRRPVGLTPESIPSPDVFEPSHPIDAAFRRAVRTAGTPIEDAQQAARAVGRTGRLGSAKTGGGATAIPGTFPVLDAPAEGIPKMLGGARKVLRGARANIVGEPSTLPGAAGPPVPPVPPGSTMQGANEFIEGTMQTAEPIMVGTALAAPVATAVSLGAGMAGQYGAQRGAAALGADPETARLAGNIGGLVAGAVGGAAAHAAPTVKPRLMEALRRQGTADLTSLDLGPAAGMQRPAVAPELPPVAEPPPTLRRPGQPPPIEGVPVEEPSSPIEELQHAVQEPGADAGRVQRSVGPGDEIEGEPVGARDTEPQGPAGPRLEPEPGQPQAETPAPQEAVPDVGAPRPPETAGPQVDEGRQRIEQARQQMREEEQRQREMLDAEARAPFEPHPRVPASELSPEMVREIRRMVHEMDASGFVPDQWIDQSTVQGPMRGNAGGGQFEKKGRTGGAQVYHDIFQMAPGTSKAQRAIVQAQLERYLAGEGGITQAVEGAIDIAKLRLEGKTRIPGDGPLSVPELAPSAGDIPTRLEPKPEGAPEPGAPLEDQGELSEGVGPEEEPGSLEDWFAQQAEAERGAPATEEPPHDHVAELADAVGGAAEPPDEDILDTGEAQTRLPGDVGAVRDIEHATPGLEVPFSLSGETVKEQGPRESGLFDQGPSEEYQAAKAAADAASAEFRQAQEAYRSKQIDDAAFLEARRKYDAAHAVFDEAFRKEQGQRPRYRKGGRYAEEGGTTLQATVLPGAQEFLEQDVVPAAKAAAQTAVRAADDIRRTFIPETRSAEAGTVGGIVRMRGGELAHRAARAEASLREYRAAFDKLPHPKDPRADVGVQTMMAIEAGDYKSIPPEFLPAAKALRALLDNRRRQVQARGRLQQAIKDYFPHIWEDPEKARSVFADWNSRRPLEGSKAFLKKRSIESIADGLDAGLVPKSRNPVTMALLKVREMDKFITAHDALQRMKQEGVAKYVPVGTAAPEGWKRIADPIGTVFKNPNIPVSEAYDVSMMQGLSDVAQDLGVTHERLMNLGSGKLGYSVQGGDKVVTKFATPDNVLAHEIGHQIDHKFKLWDRLKQLEQQYKAQGYDNWSLRKQLRAVTDLTWEGKQPQDVSEGFRKYVRKKEEQIANMVEAYVHVPDKFKQLAPDVFNVFDELVDTTPQLRKLRDVKPSMRLGVREDTVHAGGAVIGGHYWAPADGAELLNQHLSPGLAGNAVYDAYKALGNNITSVKLGLSAFHAAVESVNAVLSKAALALEYGLPKFAGGEGKPVFALKKLAEAPIAPVVDYLRGTKMREEYLTKPLTGDPTKSMVDTIVQAGGRAARDEMYRTHMGKAMVEALRTGNYPGAVARLPLAAIEATAHPIMDMLVPRLKLGAFGDLAKLELGRLPSDATPTQVRAALGKAWDSVDNRFGEMVYDNLFWKRWIKDVGQLYFRALGWNLGTAREIGGAGIDTAKYVRSLTKAETPEFSHRMAYATALATVGTGMFGAAYQKLHTGTWPTSLLDYVHPLTGGTRPDGQPERAKLPTYASDVYAFAHRPGETIAGKQADLLSGLEELAKNADYRNVQIRDPEASFSTQAKQVGTYGLEKFGVPISLSQMSRPGTSKAREIEAVAGFGTAPGWVGQSKARAMLQEFTKTSEVRTLKDEAKRQDRSALREATRAGDQQAQQDIVDKGTLGRKSVLQAVKSAALSSLQANFKRVTLDQALQVYDVATPAERGALRGLLRRKVDAAHNNAPEEAADLRERLQRVWTLPYDKPPLMNALQPPPSSTPEGAQP